MDVNAFLKEIDEYSIDDLELIFDTQKDLYSQEEMDIIHKRIEFLKQEEFNKLLKNLPKEVNCEKCDGPNHFENDKCVFCGQILDKAKYYDIEYYKTSNEDEDFEEDLVESGSSNTFTYIISFLIPIIGYIVGAILLTKESNDEKSVGKTCIILGILSTIISTVYFIISYSNLIENL